MQQVDRARGGAPISGADVLARIAQDRIPVLEQRMPLVTHIGGAGPGTRWRPRAAEQCAKTINKSHASLSVQSIGEVRETRANGFLHDRRDYRLHRRFRSWRSLVVRWVNSSRIGRIDLLLRGFLPI